MVCSEVTDAFLQFSKSRGNDLITPRGAFAGLKSGERWCLCAARWREADEAGVAPPVVLAATPREGAIDRRRERAARPWPRSAMSELTGTV